ncbi:MAG: hypothetical protein J0H68_01220 [Sphingobacteriia bacterium]|nr:hypothetical protein [Sphingobacteriia bacterium]
MSKLIITEIKEHNETIKKENFTHQITLQTETGHPIIGNILLKSTKTKTKDDKTISEGSFTVYFTPESLKHLYLQNSKNNISQEEASKMNISLTKLLSVDIEMQNLNSDLQNELIGKDIYPLIETQLNNLFEKLDKKLEKHREKIKKKNITETQTNDENNISRLQFKGIRKDIGDHNTYLLTYNYNLNGKSSTVQLKAAVRGLSVHFTIETPGYLELLEILELKVPNIENIVIKGRFNSHVSEILNQKAFFVLQLNEIHKDKKFNKLKEPLEQELKEIDMYEKLQDFFNERVESFVNLGKSELPPEIKTPSENKASSIDATTPTPSSQENDTSEIEERPLGNKKTYYDSRTDTYVEENDTLKKPDSPEVEDLEKPDSGIMTHFNNGGAKKTHGSVEDNTLKPISSEPPINTDNTSNEPPKNELIKNIIRGLIISAITLLAIYTGAKLLRNFKGSDIKISTGNINDSSWNPLKIFRGLGKSTEQSATFIKNKI